MFSRELVEEGGAGQNFQCGDDVVGFIEVFLHLVESLGNHRHHAVILTVNNVGFHGTEEFTQRDDLCAGTEVLRDTDVDRVGRHAELLALEIGNRGQFLVTGKGTGAVRAPGQHTYGGELLLEGIVHFIGDRAGPHLLGMIEITVQEGPVGNHHHREFLVHRRADDGDFDRAIAYTVPQVTFITQRAGVIDVYLDSAVRAFFDHGLEHLVHRRCHRMGVIPVVPHFDADRFGGKRTAHRSNHDARRQNFTDFHCLAPPSEKIRTGPKPKGRRESP